MLEIEEVGILEIGEGGFSLRSLYNPVSTLIPLQVTLKLLLNVQLTFNRTESIGVKKY